MGNAVQDIKYALRQIRRAPGFSVAVIVTLMLGIGANTAIFSILNGVVLRPFPYPAAERLVNVWTQYPLQDIDQFPVSRAEFHDYRLESELFEAMFAYSIQNVTLTGEGSPERVRIGIASADIWDVLGGTAVEGRLWGPAEDVPGNNDVVVLSYGFWEQTFGADPAVVGRSILLDGSPLQVVGVAGAGFGPPGQGADLYRPMAIDPARLSERSGHGLEVIGRTRPGVDVNQVLAEMRVVSARWESAYEHAHPLTATAMADTVIGDARRPLYLLGGAVGFVLLIACANVAGLLTARATARQSEIGVRAALGAPRIRLVRQIVTEGVVLAVAGGGLGLLLASWGTRALLRLEPGNLPRVGEISSDATVVGFVVALSLLAGIGFAAVPAWRVTRSAVTVARVNNRTSTSRQGFQRLMVTLEVAVAIVLVIGAGLLLRSFAELTRTDPGLEVDNVVATRIGLPFGTYDQVDKPIAFWDRLQAELETTPGFSAVGLVRSLPLRDDAFMERFLREGETEEDTVAAGHRPEFDWQTSAPGYFRALGIPLVAGRDFNAFDRPGSPRVAIVTESLVDRYFPDTDPVGQQIRILASNPRDVPFEIIGVAGDVRHDGLDVAAPIQIFTPHAQSADYRAGLLWTSAVAVRTSLSTEVAAEALRQAVWSIDPEIPLANISTMEQVLSRSVARPRFTTLLLGLLSGLALTLACVGVYSVVAYGVAQRTREMGIRLALGAEHRSILRLVMVEGLAPAALGMVIGVVGAFLAGRLLESMLYGITPTDPATFAFVTLVLGAAAATAAWVPARRATRVDPLVSLRAE